MAVTYDSEDNLIITGTLQSYEELLKNIKSELPGLHDDIDTCVSSVGICHSFHLPFIDPKTISRFDNLVFERMDIEILQRSMARISNSEMRHVVNQPLERDIACNLIAFARKNTTSHIARYHPYPRTSQLCIDDNHLDKGFGWSSYESFLHDAPVILGNEQEPSI